MADMNVVIASTGQTHADINALAALGFILPGFTPPATYWPTYTPPSATGSLYIVTYIMLVLSFICLTLRIFSRQASNHGRLLAEDWVFVVGFIFTFGLCTVTLLAISKYTYGRHIYDMTISNLQNTLYADYIFQIMLLMATPALRISLAMFTRRLQGMTEASRKQIQICDAVIVFNLCLCIATVLGFVLQCTPLSAAYDVYVDSTNNCRHQVFSNFFISACVFVADLISLLLPVGLVIRLRTSTDKRAEGIAMFVLGGFATACAGARFIYLFKAAVSTDPLYDTSKTAILSILQCNLLIMTACIPAIKSYIEEQTNKDSPSRLVRSIKQRLGLRHTPVVATTKDTTDNDLFHRISLEDEKKIEYEDNHPHAHEDIDHYIHPREDHEHYNDEEIVIVPTQASRHFYV